MTNGQMISIALSSTIGGTIGSHLGSTEQSRVNRAIAIGALGALVGAWIASPSRAPKPTASMAPQAVTPVRLP